MMQNTHRRPKEHWRRVQTKRGKKAVLVNRGLKYQTFMSRRMKSPEIRKLPVTKRMSAVAKEWNLATRGKTHMAGGTSQYERYPGEFRRYRPKPGLFRKDESGIVKVDPSAVLTPDLTDVDMKKFVLLTPAQRRMVYPHLPGKAKQRLGYARPYILGEKEFKKR